MTSPASTREGGRRADRAASSLIATPTFTERFSTLAGGYDVVLSDVWGVIHNGVAATAAACDALTRFRGQGGTVMLITNAPRPGEVVTQPRQARRCRAAPMTASSSSGDVTRAVDGSRGRTSTCSISGRSATSRSSTGSSLDFVPLEQADYVVCTGCATTRSRPPEDYRAGSSELLARKLFMLCGNPDVVVERGDRLVYCAGAIADLYGTIGGEVLYAGKPYRPIYELALQRVAAPARRDAGASACAGDRRFGAHRSAPAPPISGSTACS